jgi:PQQ-dependent dehydrogenase (methanol/ethanol family)
MKIRIACTLAACAFAAGASAQTGADLIADGKNPDNVLTYGMGYYQNRYSPLKQINRQTVKRLVPAWNVSLNSAYGEQGQPLVHDGLLFAADAEATVAIDVATGKQLWRVPVDFDPATPRVVCCGVSNKGPAVYNGKVFRGTLDAFLVALDQKTGKQLWKEKVAEWKDGFSITGAPLVANGVLISGMSGAEFGVRGFLDGYDPETGKRLWRLYTIPAPGEKGSETWPKDDSWQRGGGSTWITGSYDPELDLVYWGIGNAGPWNPGGRPGDNLYTASVLAIKPKTGEVVWHYQLVPNEMFDLDATWEWILADIPVDGAKRKVMMHFSRGGFLYVLDRSNGKLLSAKPFEKVNWATEVDMATGRPVESDVAKRVRAGEQIVGRQELVARGVQPRDRAALRQYHAQLAHDQVHAGRLQGRPALHRPGEPARAARARLADRARRRDRAAHGEAQVAHADHGHPELLGDARDRGRAALHRQGDRRVHRDRHRHRQDGVAVPDRVGRERAADHLHRPGTAIRRDPVGPGRGERRAHGRRAQECPARRLGVGVRPDAGLSYLLPDRVRHASSSDL